MKLYNIRFLKQKTNGMIQQRVESRDAILWDVQTDVRRARVKIQGSSTLVVAYYPENWEATPVWMKPGNAVRISHTGGVRGRIELVGHGTLIPTPIEGDTGTITTTLPDAILSGLQITPVI
jgi:hypothetical protein